MGRCGRRTLLALAAIVMCPGAARPAELAVVERSPSALTVQLEQAEPGRLYRVIYDDGRHRFVWENLSPEGSGYVRLADEKHLRPEQRLRCESRASPADPVIFDDPFKGAVVGKRRRQFGVPVGTFGGAGYLVPGVSDLKRDEFGNFWLYLDHAPYAVLKYDRSFEYQFALLTPERILAHDLDADGSLYILHGGNWISKHGALGEPLGAWELPLGREPGEFVSASGMAIDRGSGAVYIADETLGRVQRFGLDLELRPFLQTPWGWVGREDLAHSRPGAYEAEKMYYQLDRPRQLVLDGLGHLLVSCEHYVSKFDLGTGRQLPFGGNPVLGWGGTFTDSAFSPSAALDGHWQRQWLAGVDQFGNIYAADRENEFVVNPRLQMFAPDGVLLRTFDIEDELRDESGRPVYVTAVKGLACFGDAVWLVDAAGRIYESRGGLSGGGRLFLGPGAAGRQFDLSGAKEENFAVEVQSGRVRHRSEGRVMGYPPGERGTGNCESEGYPLLDDGEQSMWTAARLGEPFRVTLFDTEGNEIPAAQYEIEFEEKPGLFGTRYDYFRVTNNSGAEWRNIRFVAEATE